MRISKAIYLIIASLLGGASQMNAAVRLTAVQLISTDSSGAIQGVGAHRFKTTNHGGQPCIFLVRGEDLNGEIFNGPNTAANSIDIPLNAGTYTYTVYAEKSNSYSHSYYTLNLHFDQSSAPQISALVPLNTSSTQFFPPFSANDGNTENLQGYSVKAPKALLYKSGQTTVELSSFQFSSPTVFGKDRVAPFEVRKDNTLDYVGQFSLEVKAPPEIAAGGVVNAASFTAKVAPGSLFSIFGTSLATAAQSATSLPLPSSLAGTSVTIGGKPAPLFFVSPDQVNAQVPYELAEGTTVPVIVTVNGVSSPVGNVSVVTAAPGIFQFGQKRAVAQNQDYTVNNADNGAAGGSYIVTYLTGFGQVDNPVQTGATAFGSPLSRSKYPVSATVNGVAANITFAGLTPDFIGLAQVNLQLPNLAPGTYPLVVTVNGEKSNAAMITIK